ncbi:MAG TPA: hypothetical protein VGJ60_06325 [Chloroflexota bacterium]
MPRFNPRPGQRLRWRVIVQTQGRLDPSRGTRPLAWHLMECSDPALLDGHCAIGRRLLADGADPDGHCLIDGTCPRCEGQ